LNTKSGELNAVLQRGKLRKNKPAVSKNHGKAQKLGIPINSLGAGGTEHWLMSGRSLPGDKPTAALPLLL
jgi:hypothetical protein